MAASVLPKKELSTFYADKKKLMQNFTKVRQRFWLQSFLRNLIEAVPYKIHKVLTDNGMQFTNHDYNKHAFKLTSMLLSISLSLFVTRSQIEHRKTQDHKHILRLMGG